MAGNLSGAAQDPVLNIAVVGTGLIGRKHIGLVSENARLHLAATVNPSGIPDDLAGQHQIPHFQNCADLLASLDVDGVIVASPNETHADISVELIRAGVPVLIEKPIAGTVEDGLRIIAAHEEYGTPVLMGHHRRYNPIIDQMARYASDGPLGNVVGFSGIWSVYKPDPYYGAAWRTGPTGGPIMINLIHEIDYLQAMFGRIETVGAMEAAKRRTHSGEEALALLLRFESGLIGTILLSDSASSPWSWEQATGENVPAFPMNKESPYRFIFERGAMEFPSLKCWQQDEPSWHHAFQQHDPDLLQEPMRAVFAQQIDHFYDVAARRVPPRVTARDGLEALNAALTVKRALADGCAFLEVPPLSA